MKKLFPPLSAVLLALWVGGVSLVGCQKHSSDFIINSTVATGSWTIAVQIPSCTYENIKVKLPEREGDVVTVFCVDMPVKVK